MFSVGSFWWRTYDNSTSFFGQGIVLLGWNVSYAIEVHSWCSLPNLNAWLQANYFSQYSWISSLFLMVVPSTIPLFTTKRLNVCNRPKITFAIINQVCRFMHQPTTRHWLAVICIRHYLNGTISHALLLLRGSIFTLNVDWIVSHDNRR